MESEILPQVELMNHRNRSAGDIEIQLLGSLEESLDSTLWAPQRGTLASAIFLGYTISLELFFDARSDLSSNDVTC